MHLDAFEVAACFNLTRVRLKLIDESTGGVELMAASTSREFV